MKVVKNTDNNTIKIGYEGWDYEIPSGATVKVEDDVFKFLTETLPLSFNYGQKLQKEEAVDVKKTKTKVFTPQNPYKEDQGTEDMKIAKSNKDYTFGDDLPPSGTIDKDGISYYGEGLVIE